jgi:hypothetical protein
MERKDVQLGSIIDAHVVSNDTSTAADVPVALDASPDMSGFGDGGLVMPSKRTRSILDPSPAHRGKRRRSANVGQKMRVLVQQCGAGHPGFGDNLSPIYRLLAISKTPAQGREQLQIVAYVRTLQNRMNLDAFAAFLAGIILQSGREAVASDWIVDGRTVESIGDHFLALECQLCSGPRKVQTLNEFVTTEQNKFVRAPPMTAQQGIDQQARATALAQEQAIAVAAGYEQIVTTAPVRDRWAVLWSRGS